MGCVGAAAAGLDWECIHPAAISDVRAATCCSLSPNPGQWWRPGACQGEKIMVLLSQLNIFRSIPYHPHTRVQNGLVIVSSVCNSIIIHTTWRTQGSSLSECLRCILSLFPPESHLTRTLWRESRCSSVQLLYKYGINVQTLEYVTTKQFTGGALGQGINISFLMNK